MQFVAQLSRTKTTSPGSPRRSWLLGAKRRSTRLWQTRLCRTWPAWDAVAHSRGLTQYVSDCFRFSLPLTQRWLSAGSVPARRNRQWNTADITLLRQLRVANFSLNFYELFSDSSLVRHWLEASFSTSDSPIRRCLERRLFPPGGWPFGSTRTRESLRFVSVLVAFTRRLPCAALRAVLWWTALTFTLIYAVLPSAWVCEPTRRFCNLRPGQMLHL